MKKLSSSKDSKHLGETAISPDRFLRWFFFLSFYVREDLMEYLCPLGAVHK